MPRSLSFVYNDQRFVCEITKMDRSKLYGTVTTETRDKDQKRCDLATLAYDGKTVISTGGTAIGYMNPQGEWLNRSDLTAVDAEGEPVETVESSFKIDLQLETIVTDEEFLNHSVRLIYRLNPVEGNSSECRSALDNGTIFKFNFSYRGGTSVDPAFVMSNKEGLWLLITDSNRVEFAGLAEVAVCAKVEEPDEEKEDSEELDFGML